MFLKQFAFNSFSHLFCLSSNMSIMLIQLLFRTACLKFELFLQFITFYLNIFSSVRNLLLSKPDLGRIPVLALFCTDLTALSPCYQDLMLIFSQYGLCVWLIRYSSSCHVGRKIHLGMVVPDLMPWLFLATG